MNYDSIKAVFLGGAAPQKRTRRTASSDRLRRVRGEEAHNFFHSFARQMLGKPFRPDLKGEASALWVKN